MFKEVLSSMMFKIKHDFADSRVRKELKGTSTCLREFLLHKSEGIMILQTNVDTWFSFGVGLQRCSDSLQLLRNLEVLVK